MFLISIIVIIVLTIQITNKNNEIAFLRSKLKNQTYNFCPKCGYKFEKNQNIIEDNELPIEDNVVKDNELPIEENTKSQEIKTKVNQNAKVEYTKEINKNSAILITGSILIILAAITFLTTTWDYTNNILKIIILFLMFVTFEGISRTAKNKKLTQTSKAFHYIALAYLPIILFALPALHLLNDFMNYSNVGRNIYFTICSVILTSIYYNDTKKTKSKITMVGSIATSILSCLFLTAIFKAEASYLILTLLTYIMVISILYYKNVFVFDKQTHLRVIQTLLIGSIAVIIYYNPLRVFTSKATIATIISNILLIINSYIYLIKIQDEKEIYKSLFPFLVALTALSISSLFDAFIIKQIIILTGVIITYIYDIINNEEISIYTTYETLLIMIGLCLFTNLASEKTIIPTYLLTISETGLMWLSYLNSKEKTVTSTIGSVGIIISAFNLLHETNLNMIILSFISIIMIELAQIINNKEIRNAFNTVGYISYILTSIFYYESTIIHLISLTLFIGISFINKLQKYHEFRIVSYIYFNQLVTTILIMLNIKDNNIYSLVIPFTTIIITLLETLWSKIKNKENTTYLIISYVISMISLIVNTDSIFNFIYLIIIDICYLMYISDNGIKNKEYQLPALLSIIPYISSKVLVINYINYMYSVSLLLIAAVVYLSGKEKHPMYYIMFYIYAATHIIIFNDINYIRYIILLIGTATIYLVEKQYKDIYKTMIYILCYLIFRQIVKDLNLSTITFITSGSLLIMASLICRDIIKKYFPEYKILLYISYAIINTLTFESYTSQPDAVFYLFFLTLLTIITYNFKFGPELTVSLITILINTFILTKTFWTAIPWWIYILLIGTILVVFAINNEANIEKENNKEKLKKIKEHLDL